MRIVLLILFFFSSCVLNPAYSAKKIQRPVLVKTTQVHTYPIYITDDAIYDGDTITKNVLVDLGFGVFMMPKLRLSRIQAPEIRTRNKAEKIKGYAAKAHLIKLISGKEDVTIKVLKKGKYGRWISEIFLGKINISDQMVTDGFAKYVKY